MDIIQQIHHNLVKSYQIKHLLGEGGSSTTYEAIDLKTHQRVALKALSLQGMNDWKVLELFEREANVLSKLNHPAIPRYLDYFYVDTPDNRCFYLVQELAEGQSLATLIQNGWHVSEQEIRRIAKQILEILVYLHSQTPPVIHRDIKPDNIVLKLPINSDKQKGWAVCLVDFGAVQNTYYNTLMRGSTVVGTYGYMAPEQFLGQALPATDLYGLGATLLYLLTHRSPAELPTNRLEIDFRSQIDISAAFADWLEKMLASDLENRFKSAQEALELLPIPRMVIPKSNRATQSKKRLILGIAVVATAAVFNHFQYPILNRIGFTPDPVIKAVEKGDAKTVRHYLDLGISANTRVNNQNLLHLAGSKEVAELLIAKGADVNANDAFGFTPLHFAAAFDRIEVAQTLIAKGADLNAQSKPDVDIWRWNPIWTTIWGKSFSADYIGATPLFFAQSPEMAKFLIAKGADVNAKSKFGRTPLHMAQSKAIAQILLVAGAKINIKDENARYGKGRALLHNAAKLGFKELVQQLINNGANVVIRDRYKRTPLHYAATKEVAALLMLDINARDESGNTPLHLAINNNHQQVASFLIANGAKVNVKDIDGKTPLHIAVSKNMQHINQLLLAYGADIDALDNHKQTPLDMAVDMKLQDIVALLITKHPDVNTEDKDGRNLLHIAVSFKLKDVAKQLIAKGAFVNAKNNLGETPLHIAVSQGSQDIAELLIAKAARVNARNETGQTPLFKAIAIGHNDIAALLINNGTDVNNIDAGGTTPLHQAAGYGTVEILKLLIAKGATINARNTDGRTPLYKAIAIGHNDIAALLINNGADVNNTDACGTTPLHQAAGYGTVEILKLLIAKGATIDAKNCYGMTPLNLAETSWNPNRKAAAQILRSTAQHTNSQLTQVEVITFVSS